MFGEPTEESDECNARLFLADNYGHDASVFQGAGIPSVHRLLRREQRLMRLRFRQKQTLRMDRKLCL